MNRLGLPVAVSFDCAEPLHIFGVQNFHPFTILRRIGLPSHVMSDTHTQTSLFVLRNSVPCLLSLNVYQYIFLAVSIHFCEYLPNSCSIWTNLGQIYDPFWQPCILNYFMSS